MRSWLGELAVGHAGKQTAIGQLEQQARLPRSIPSSAPVSWVDTDHELVIGLDAVDLTYPVGPVVEVRLLQMVDGQSMLRNARNGSRSPP